MHNFDFFFKLNKKSHNFDQAKRSKQKKSGSLYVGTSSENKMFIDIRWHNEIVVSKKIYTIV